MAMGATVFTVGGTAQNFTTTSPKTFSATPSGGDPRAVLVAIVQNAATGDTISAVSYGGVALTRVERAIDSAGETGAVEIWFLGSGIPTGTQTISITHGGAATTKWPVAVGYLAGADTEVVTFAKDETGDHANPSVVLDTGAVEAIRVGAIFSGLDTPTSLAVLTGMSAVTTNDFGTQSARYDRQTSNSTGSFTFGYTAVSDDAALVGIAIQEVPGATENPYPYVGGGYYPTEG